MRERRGQPIKTAEEEAAQPAATPAHLAISPDAPDALLLARSYASEGGASLAIERSTDGGASWRKLVAAGPPTKAKARLLTALKGGVLLLNTDQGTFRSADDGSTWQALEGPLSSGGVADFLPWPEPKQDTDRWKRCLRATVLAATRLWALHQPGWRAPCGRRHGSGLPINSGIAGLLTDARRGSDRSGDYR